MSWSTTMHPWAFDFDYNGHLTAAVYPKAFEQARVEYLRERWGTRTPEYVVAAHRMEYTREILEEHLPLQVVITPSRIGRSSVELTEELLNAEGTVCNRSVATLVSWNRQARCPRPMTEAERAVLVADLDARREPENPSTPS